MLCGTIAEATHFMILKSYIYIPKDHFKILLQMKFFDHLLPNQPYLKNVPYTRPQLRSTNTGRNELKNQQTSSYNQISNIDTS